MLEALLDSALAAVANCIERYHEVVADFPAPIAYEWSDRGRDPVGPAEVLCHNDLAPWNLVHGPDGGWTFIDWDLAAPGRRAWDLAWALLSFVPLLPDSDLSDAETADRIRVFRNAYGAAEFPARVIEVAVERCGHEARRIRQLGERGVEPYSRLLAEGHYEVWAAGEEHIAGHADEWHEASLT